MSDKWITYPSLFHYGFVEEQIIVSLFLFCNLCAIPFNKIAYTLETCIIIIAIVVLFLCRDKLTNSRVIGASMPMHTHGARVSLRGSFMVQGPLRLGQPSLRCPLKAMFKRQKLNNRMISK